jgi:hypothetical protein
MIHGFAVDNCFLAMAGMALIASLLAKETRNADIAR